MFQGVKFGVACNDFQICSLQFGLYHEGFWFGLSLVHRCLSLLRHCPTSACHCLNLVHHCLNVIYRCFIEVYTCLTLIFCCFNLGVVSLHLYLSLSDLGRILSKHGRSLSELGLTMSKLDLSVPNLGLSLSTLDVSWSKPDQSLSNGNHHDVGTPMWHSYFHDVSTPINILGDAEGFMGLFYGRRFTHEPLSIQEVSHTKGGPSTRLGNLSSTTNQAWDPHTRIVSSWIISETPRNIFSSCLWPTLWCWLDMLIVWFGVDMTRYWFPWSLLRYSTTVAQISMGLACPYICTCFWRAGSHPPLKTWRTSAVLRVMAIYTRKHASCIHACINASIHTFVHPWMLPCMNPCIQTCIETLTMPSCMHNPYMH